MGTARARPTITVVSAGLSSLFAAALLARSGYRVVVDERDGDLRASDRRRASPNLAISERGLAQLAGAGLREAVLERVASARGRLITVPAARPSRAVRQRRPGAALRSAPRLRRRPATSPRPSPTCRSTSAVAASPSTPSGKSCTSGTPRRRPSGPLPPGPSSGRTRPLGRPRVPVAPRPLRLQPGVPAQGSRRSCCRRRCAGPGSRVKTSCTCAAGIPASCWTFRTETTAWRCRCTCRSTTAHRSRPSRASPGWRRCSRSGSVRSAPCSRRRRGSPSPPAPTPWSPCAAGLEPGRLGGAPRRRGPRDGAPYGQDATMGLEDASVLAGCLDALAPDWDRAFPTYEERAGRTRTPWPTYRWRTLGCWAAIPSSRT